MTALKEELISTKNQLNSLFNQKVFVQYWREFDPFKNERSVISKMANTYNVSNAWIKCYEMLQSYKLIDTDSGAGTGAPILHFDNAAFPGSFIISTHHYATTMTSRDYDWRGSSLLVRNEENADPLEDKYRLYANYPEKWLMNDKNNGDVTVESNVEDMRRQIGGKVDLYTSDLGFEVKDYNAQEMEHAKANMGQIISGLMTLKPGGSFITKQYTFFESVTISIIYATASFFDEFYICKPYSSREANSEIYLVGKGFRGGADAKHPYIRAMFDRIQDKVPFVPLFDFKDYPNGFLKEVIGAATTITMNQVRKIDADIARYRSAMAAASRNRGFVPAYKSPIVKEFMKIEELRLESWYYNNPMRPITDRLNMADIGIGR